MGDTVNLAARLTSRAGDREILATADVLDAARTLYASEREPLLVKGKERAVTAHHVGAPTGTREPAAGDEMPLIGRDQEVATLGQALEELGCGSSACSRSRASRGWASRVSSPWPERTRWASLS